MEGPAVTSEGPVTIEVVKPGVQTTVQDLGRRGLLGSGVPVGGAMDRRAARIANWLVGNPENAAVLETTMAGPELLFHADCWVAVGGAQFQGIPAWQPFEVKSGELLSLKEVAAGCRGYLAVAGGFDVPAVMGSASTYLRASAGGFVGRALRKDDLLRVGVAGRREHQRMEHWHISSSVLPAYVPQPLVRVLRGAQWSWFTEEARARFFEEPYLLLPKSDRMGLRLSGGVLSLTESREMVSEAVAFGSVQVPADGQPIVLMADCQTIGGYPRIGEVSSVDLPLLAQLRPGDAVRFAPISMEEAQSLLLEQEHALARLHEGLTDKLK